MSTTVAAPKTCPDCGGKPWSNDDLEWVCSMCNRVLGILVESIPGVMTVNGNGAGSLLQKRLGRPPKAVEAPAPSVVAPQSAQTVWETFETKGNGRAARRGVSLQIRGNLRISPDIGAMFNGARTVELLYDRAGTRMGIRPTTKPHGRMLFNEVGRPGKGIGYRVHARGFFLYYGLPLPPRAMSLTYTAEDGTLIVQLKKDWTK